MLQFGKNIKNSLSDKLEKISLEDLYLMISKSDLELKNMIRRLRTLRTIDEKKYKETKVLLPYFTTGIFNPPYRKTEHFAATEYFVLDFDHFSEGDKDLNNFRLRLAQDPRVAMLFISPGNDGLKLIFRLSEKCFDAAKYQMFYKLFAKDFSNQYEMNQVIDTKTSDVTRATFVSWDSEAYYNAEALPIEMQKYINFDNEDEVSDAQLIISEIDKKADDAVVVVKEELGGDILLQIKQRLKPETTKPKEKYVIVPEELDKIEIDLSAYIETFGLKVREVKSISYGKKFIMDADIRWCEINLFFGKKGFTPVISPKNGSNDELAQACIKIFYCYVNQI